MFSSPAAEEGERIFTSLEVWIVINLEQRGTVKILNGS